MKLNLPDWHTPEQLLAILHGLPENRRNRALYLLSDQYGGENSPSAEQAALRRLLADPELRGLESIKYWLQNALYGGGGAFWLAWWPAIVPALDSLHHESCRVYGEYGGMFASTEQAAEVVAQLLALGSGNAREIAECCLHWHEELCRLHPDWVAQVKEAT